MNDLTMISESDQLSGVLHELKTPLAVILSTVQLVEKQNVQCDSAMPQKYRNTIRLNCYRLLKLVNNLVDINKIGSGYVVPNLTEYDLIYLTEEITHSIIPYADQKNISVLFDTDVEELVTALDIDKWERILLNLLSNAVKFTPENGKIEVTVMTTEQYAYISVKDTGIGIAEDKQKEIFKKYTQVHDSATISQKGSGLGLTIVLSFVKLLGGTMNISSIPGEGTTFTIKFPLKHSTNEQKAAIEESCLQKRIIDSINIEFSDIYNRQENI